MVKSDRRTHPRSRTDATALLHADQRRMGGHLTDLSRGGFLLAPYDELAVSGGSPAVLQVGHRRIECEILGHSDRGVHCRFRGPLGPEEYERLLIGARPSRRVPDLPPLIDNSSVAAFKPRQSAANALAGLARLCGADDASLLELSPSGLHRDVLVSAPAEREAQPCPCSDAACWVAPPTAGDGSIFAASSETGHRLCLARSSGPIDLAVRLGRPGNEAPFSEQDRERMQSQAENLWPLFAACHDLIRQTQQIQALYGLFESLSLPLFVVDATLHVHDVNPAGRELLAHGDSLQIAGGRLTCGTTSDNARLRQMLEEPAEKTAGGVAIGRERSPHPYLATIVPAARLYGKRALFVLAIRDLTIRPAAEIQIDAKTFGFTKAETRLAHLLVGGHSLNSAAASLGVSLNTARTHMKRIYQKTATSRQAQLVQLLSNSSLGFHASAPTESQSEPI